MVFRLIFFILILTFSCKDSKKDLVLDETSSLEKAYAENSSDENFIAVINKLGELISDQSDAASKKKYIEKGINFSKVNEKDSYYYMFLKEYIKYFPEEKLADEYLWKLANQIKSEGNTEISDILFQGIAESSSDAKNVEEAKKNIKSEIKDWDVVVRAKAESIFVDPDQTGMNTQNIIKYVEVCEAIVLAFPKNPLASEYLFRAAEMSRSVRNYSKTLNLYDWIVAKYPDYDKTSMVFFLKGFVYENEFKNKEKAKEIYTAFLNSYPNDQMAGDVRFLLENIDKTEEEMLKLIEDRQKQAGQTK